MKKRLVVFAALMNMPLLGFCIGIGSRLNMLNGMSDDGKAEARLGKILAAIKAKDKGSLKAMFSKNALGRAPDIDKSIDRLFDYFAGEVTRQDSDGLSADEHDDYGKKIKTVKSFFKVLTKAGEYEFSIMECTSDSSHPEDVGLFAIYVDKEDEKEARSENPRDWEKPGVYCY